MNKYILYILISCFLASFFASCSSDDSAKKEYDYKDTISIAVTPTFDCLPVIVAKECGIADSLGHFLRLQYHLAKADCDTALIGGSACAMFSDFGRADYLKGRWTKDVLARRGKKAKVDSLSVIAHDNFPLFILTNYKSRLNEAKQLVDKMIALDRQSVEYQIAQHILDSVRLTNDKTFLVEMHNLKTRSDMVLNNTMDAAVFTEPQASVVRSAGHKLIFSATHFKGKSLGCLVATHKSKEIKEVYNLACDFINKHGIHSCDSILVKRYGLTASEIKKIKDLKFKKIK